MNTFFSSFHFLRPWWFLALVPAAILLLIIRQRHDAARAWRGLIAPHLLPHLLSSEAKHSRIGAATLLGIGWLLTIIALAGPAWRHEPAPFAEDTAALVIVVKVTPSMKSDDVPPDRLTRSIQKIHDLLSLRRGAKTALVAYSGSAHAVMPLTTDGGIITTFADVLDPKIMPKEGDDAVDALKLADQVLVRSNAAGSILWITDGVDPAETEQLKAWRRSSATPVQVLAPLLSGSEMDSLQDMARVADAKLVALTPDPNDVEQIAHTAKFAPVLNGQASERWQESGYWMMPLLTLLALPYFRRGWLVPTASQ